MAEDHFFTNAAAQPTQQAPHIYRPIPRRNFSTNSHSSDSGPDPFTNSQDTPPPSSPQFNSRGSSDFVAQLNARLLRSRNSGNGNVHERERDVSDGGGLGSRNKSSLNMTSSTLYGIYDDVMGSSTAGERSEAPTPWGTGAETPARHSLDSGMGQGVWENGIGSPDGGRGMTGKSRGPVDDVQTWRTRQKKGQTVQRHGIWKAVVIAAKLSALFLFGLVYGVIVSHLHDTRELSAVRVSGLDRESWIYLAAWGFAGVGLGSLLPYVDLVWEGEKNDKQAREVEAEKQHESSFTEQMNEVVRSVGAFVGIAFAIRRLPWQSTLQLTVTLALVNPALWYILDRSKPGLSFSLVVTSLLTSFIFLSNPDVLPSPALPATTNSTQLPSARTGVDQELFAGVVSYETLAVVTWVGSVLFCSCVCFGNIGRRLAVLDDWNRRR
ncbi:insulin-induced protein-domain-containing protein [Clohesyomyces aquaticus]|uniref:Insulin-induced protein-domain-containing protein n=1 Tax=Clohesyomyces aquaticus TaxID=1231657 RepID=A0A1Y2A182_9PLEO|nr:insulin-induced protein-domain-containing protein [Clohesyomyces aquaticus]